ncbi:MAG: hypothetical protein ACRYF4_11110 [Janthinobacterium lividum]
MQASSIPSINCQAGERQSARVLRLGTASLLLIVCLLECGMAVLMVAGSRVTANLVFLLCTLILLAATLISLRAQSGRALIVVQSAAAAALLTLFWASSNQAHAGPSITIGHATYELTLTLAGLLFIAMLLARLLRRTPSEQACNCG